MKIFNSSFIKIFAAAILVLVVAVFFLLRPRPLEKYREANEIGGHSVTVDVCVERGRDSKKVSRVLDDVWQRMRDISQRMSSTAADSDIAKMNRSYQNPQQVGADTVEVLGYAAYYNKMTRGVFAMTTGRAVGVSHFKVLPGNIVELTDKDTHIDYGGIASGFAIDQAVQMLRKRGFDNFLIDAGGSMYAAGLNCNRKPWTIAIKNPQNKNRIFDIIEVSNASVKMQNQSTNVTLIAKTALDSDVLASALKVLNSQQSVALIDSLGKKYASVAEYRDRNGRSVMVKSANYKNFQIKKQSR